MVETSSVPGSGGSLGRPFSPSDLQKRISPALKLHDVTETSLASIDAVTYEVLRHRLWSITEEMGETLKRMSGSVVVTDANDFNFAITDEVGQEVQIGPYNLQLAASIDLAIMWTLEHRSGNPGIEQGDMFLCNDPWIGGGLHQNDVSIFAPLFWKGRLFAWSGASAHQVDLGGVAPGSWTPRSQDVFWESLPTPPIKIVRNFHIMRDVEEMFVRRSRVPELVALDLRALVGANKIAHDRLRILISRYGADVIKAVMKRIMNDAERRLRKKLRELPDGKWRSVAYQEQASAGDRGVYKIVSTMTKQGDHLSFDFRGTDPQKGMINCTYAGMRAGVLSPVLTILAGDIPWAPGGLTRAIEIISDEGTLNNAKFPAGICKASVASGRATIDAVVECISKMLDTSVEHRKSAISVSCGTWLLSVLAGTNQYGKAFVTMLMDPMASGMGAKSRRDGIDTGGSANIPMGRAPDAEMTEFMFPVLLLWRREETDSGGPGKFRGGVTASVCLTPHGTTSLELVCSGSGRTVSMNVGLAGGYPGNNEVALVIRNANLAQLFGRGMMPLDLNDIQGRRDPLPDEIETSLGSRDVYYMCWQAGGGYGDPIQRDPALVERDVRDYKVRARTARDIYGVIVDPRTYRLNSAATEKRRLKIRNERRKKSRFSTTPRRGGAGREKGKTVQRVDDNLVINKRKGGFVVSCANCGQTICDKDENYLQHLARYEGAPAEGGPQIWTDPSQYVDEPVVFRQYYCPRCFTAMLTQVVPADHPIATDTAVSVR